MRKICLERDEDYLHMVQLMPLPSPKPRQLLHHLNPDWFYLSGTVLPRLSWKIGRYTDVVKGKGKVFPYSLPSVGPGGDPGVQAVSPQVT